VSSELIDNPEKLLMKNPMTRALIFCLFMLVNSSWFSASQADQNAPSLPALFDKLADATDPSEANRIEGQIWQQWLVAPDDASATLMSQIVQAMEGADLKVALRINDELVESYPEFAEGWNKRATLYYLLGDSAKSVADIRQTIALEPRHFGAIAGLGLIFLRDENFEAALEAFEQVLNISPESINAQRSVARVRQELGREI